MARVQLAARVTQRALLRELVRTRLQLKLVDRVDLQDPLQVPQPLLPVQPRLHPLPPLVPPHRAGAAPHVPAIKVSDTYINYFK